MQPPWGHHVCVCRGPLVQTGGVRLLLTCGGGVLVLEAVLCDVRRQRLPHAWDGAYRQLAVPKPPWE